MNQAEQKRSKACKFTLEVDHVELSATEIRPKPEEEVPFEISVADKPANPSHGDFYFPLKVHLVGV